MQQSKLISNSGFSATISEDEKRAWYEIYIEDGDCFKSDLHQRFAEATGRSRKEAKERAYRIMFQGDFMENMVNSIASQGQPE